MTGDGFHGRVMDVTSIRVDNRDRAVVTTVSVERLTAGDIGLRLRTRGGGGHYLSAGVYSERAHGRQRELFGTRHEKQCRGLRVRWDFDADTIRLRMPSRCLNGGDFGAVQAKVITGVDGGDDADLAPQGPRGAWRWTAWTPRG